MLQMRAEPEAVLDRVISFMGQDPALKTRPAAAAAMRPKDRTSARPLKDRNSSGWSLPLKDRDATRDLDALYRFFGPANEDLYRLMEALGGPAIGWNGGRFPTRWKDNND